MSRRQKQIDRLKSKPKDYTFDEAVGLLGSLGFQQSSKGKTSGSRVMFEKGGYKILVHKPHPQKELKPYQINELLTELAKEGLI